MIDSKKAIEAARKAAQNFFRGEDVLEISLEEVGQDAKGNWLITIGVLRPRILPRKAAPREVGFAPPTYRKYKQFVVDGAGKVSAMKIRQV